MTQEQRHKDLDDAGHAPHAAAGHPEPGKQSLTEIARLKKEVRDAYPANRTRHTRPTVDRPLAGRS